MKKISWIIMMLLACAVALYGWALVFIPEVVNNSAMQHHFTERPVPMYLHFTFGPLALAIGGLQFLGAFRARKPAIHRWIGRIYVASCLLSGVGGLFLALGTDQGGVAMAGFLGLAIAWIVTTSFGYADARARRFDTHREWMIRSFALTLAAVTLRIYLPLFLGGFGMAFSEAYPIIAFLCWVPNLIVAEVVIARKRRPGALQPAA
ncbi:MAG: DUF2306 domain-containing protein [Alphaproteobacteria bacterium]|nr:DUF2306 domain-containing protein [Alphaproteobacteria bacterium]